MAKKDPRRTEYRILKALLGGKYLKWSIPEARYPAFLEETGYNADGAANDLRKRWEQEGVIVGYVPVLSEKGRKFFEALQALYAEEKPPEPAPAPSGGPGVSPE